MKAMRNCLYRRSRPSKVGFYEFELDETTYTMRIARPGASFCLSHSKMPWPLQQWGAPYHAFDEAIASLINSRAQGRLTRTFVTFTSRTIP